MGLAWEIRWKGVNLSSPTHDPELHFGPKLRLGRQDLSEKDRALAWNRHLSGNRAGPPDIKSAEKWALAFSSSTSQPSHIELQEQCEGPPPPLLLEKQQNGGSTSQNLVSWEAQHIPRWSLLAPNSSLDLYPGKEKASTLMRLPVWLKQQVLLTGQKTVVSNQKWAKLCLPALRNGNLPTTGTRVRRL